MYFWNVFCCIILLIFVIVKVEGNDVNLIDVIYGFNGYNFDFVDMM